MYVKFIELIRMPQICLNYKTLIGWHITTCGWEKNVTLIIIILGQANHALEDFGDRPVRLLSGYLGLSGSVGIN